ncbi:DUF1428 domain-containing protein [Hyphomicrobium sp.]|uniref:DUF1428 domain-containing protein n=1 Tax=Hyphomicrobium sp. TaxID=82 RepID=UPI002BE148B7|nr:DUF1428 domain-containing protein [Hyphomicrobium sp.]HRN88158.1 DUF1428 domain-containing protein [Hyphomicrobium sp.]HRQ28256.1 DUF1428 domain-containing protein [Hyphomicrobium sp.]
MAYVDGYLLIVPKKNIEAYRKLAKVAAKVWREHGALEYRECVGDDLDAPFGRPFPKLLRLKPDETAVFSWVVYRSRAQRDRVNAKVMKDPRIAGMDHKAVPFDAKRMSMGGFSVLVSA